MTGNVLIHTLFSIHTVRTLSGSYVMGKKENESGSKAMKTALVYAMICLGVVIFVMTLEKLEVFGNMENASQDLRFRVRGLEDHNDDIVVVGIDPQTLDMLMLIGMPPRDFHATLIENLYKAGAKAVLFDVLFLNLTGSLQDSNSLEGVASWSDSMLSDALLMYPETDISRKTIVEMADATQQSVGEATLPSEMFRYQDQIAFVDMYTDGDSFLRRTKLIVDDGMPAEFGWNYSFALKAVMHVMDADTAWVDTKRHLAHVGDKVIPLNEEDFMVINYAMDETTFQKENGYISYEQVYDDSEWGLGILMEKDRFKGKVVMIGAAWPESHDNFPTPFLKGTKIFSKNEDLMYGVHIHKNIATTILEDRFIIPWRSWQMTALIILMAIVATLINFRFKGFMGLFLSVVLVGLYSLIALQLFLKVRWQVPLIAPAFVTVFTNYVSVVTYNFLAERRQKAMIRGAFAQYVPPAVVGELINNPDLLTLGGEERVMSVIFSDVAGFTTISEGLTPTELVELLNEYLTAMTDIVLDYDGIIDKYEGDAIMAEFGAPLPDDDHAIKACFVALDMQVKLAELRAKLLAEGRPELRARVGINSGSMVIGNMGSTRIFDYTVMGDNVNLSSRLEGANKAYGTYIMCSEATRKMAEESIITRELDLLQVKGKTEGVLVHEILAKADDGLSDNIAKSVECYNRGHEMYKTKQWDEGIKHFTEALKHNPEDAPAKVYIERCEEFKNNPPPEDWDGIFIMRTK